MSTSVQDTTSNDAWRQTGKGMTEVQPLPDQRYPVDLHRTGLRSEGDGTVMVSTADLNAALDILTRHGRLLICGPPGSGKTRLADAVQKVFFKERGFTPTDSMSLIQTCHSPLLHRSNQPSRPTLAIEDDYMGNLRIHRDTYRQCLSFLFNTQALWDRPTPSPDTYSSFLIVTCYPHVLPQIRMLDEGAPVALADPEVVHHLRRDPLHPALPFRPDLQRYAFFLVQMMREESGRLVTCAVLALALEGWRHDEFLLDPPTLLAELDRLGFRGLSCPQMADMADFLRGFILAEEGVGFVSRFMYDAVGLGLGIAYSVHMTLLKCDTRFLAQYIRMDPDAKPTIPYQFARMDPEADPNSFHLGVPEDVDYPRQLFLEKAYEALAEDAVVMEMSQHPSLAYLQTVKEFAAFCSQKKNHTERVMSVVDKEHKLPLLYWSVWSLATHLNHWCLSTMQDDIRKTRVLTEPLLTSLLACVLFAEAGDSTLVKTSRLVKELAQHKLKLDSDGSRLVLPVPTLRQQDARLRLQQVQTRLKWSLRYLQDGDLSFPASFVKVSLVEDNMTVQVPSKAWYLLLRLLTDQHLDEKDEKGDTALHLAAHSGERDVIQMIVKSGASLAARNRKGLTPPQLARKRKHHAENSSTASPPLSQADEERLHTACHEGDTELVKVLLCQGCSLDSRDLRGNTPLHLACRAGHIELVVLMLQLEANLNARNVDKQTPVQEASASGHQQLVRLLSQHGASGGAKNLQG